MLNSLYRVVVALKLAVNVTQNSRSLA